jgi:hypothetical protein
MALTQESMWKRHLAAWFFLGKAAEAEGGSRRGQFFPVDILEEELRFLIGVLGSSSSILSGEVES